MNNAFDVYSLIATNINLKPVDLEYQLKTNFIII